MELSKEVLDWSLLSITMTLETFYLIQIVKEEKTILMDMMKYLIINDLISGAIILLHDIPSYFLETPISELSFFFLVPGVFSHCFPFFFALLMLPLFSGLNLMAIVAVQKFGSFRKSVISTLAVISCYIVSLLLSIPLVTEYCRYHYNKETHTWFYDYSKPYTYLYQRINLSLQVISITSVCVTMTIVVIYLVRRSSNSRCSPVQTTTNSSTANAKANQVKATTQPRSVPVPGGRRRVIDQAFAYSVLCLCFIIGTVCFNAMIGCRTPACQFTVIVTSTLNKSKWIIYCFLMRRKATISRFWSQRAQ